MSSHNQHSPFFPYVHATSVYLFSSHPQLQKKIAPSRPRGNFSGSKFQMSGKCHELPRKTIRFHPYYLPGFVTGFSRLSVKECECVNLPAATCRWWTGWVSSSTLTSLRWYCRPTLGRYLSSYTRWWLTRWGRSHGNMRVRSTGMWLDYEKKPELL